MPARRCNSIEWSSQRQIQGDANALANAYVPLFMCEYKIVPIEHFIKSSSFHVVPRKQCMTTATRTYLGHPFRFSIAQDES